MTSNADSAFARRRVQIAAAGCAKRRVLYDVTIRYPAKPPPAEDGPCFGDGGGAAFYREQLALDVVECVARQLAANPDLSVIEIRPVGHA